MVASIHKHSPDTELGSCLSAWPFDNVTQQFFCAIIRSVVNWSVMLLFDPENECCFCPGKAGGGGGGILLFTEPAVSAQDHTAMQPGTLGPQIIRYKRSVRHFMLHPTPWQDCFSPIMCFQLTDWCNNYEHLAQQIWEDMWKGNRQTKTSEWWIGHTMSVYEKSEILRSFQEALYDSNFYVELPSWFFSAINFSVTVMFCAHHQHKRMQ